VIPFPTPGIDLAPVRRYVQAMGREAGSRLLVRIKRELEASADEVVEAARKNLDSTKLTKSTGMLSTSIHRERHARPQNDFLGIGIGWGLPYGRVLEYGPSVSAWVIRPKFRKALRFWMGAQIFTPSGRKSRRMMTEKNGAGIVYRSYVLHRDYPSHRRPHLVQAAETVNVFMQIEMQNILVQVLGVGNV